MIGAVGFMNQRLDVPKDVDPQWISLMESCWHRYVLTLHKFLESCWHRYVLMRVRCLCSEPQRRPTFQEVMEKLRELQRKYTIQFQAARAASIDNSSLKEK